MRGNARFLKQVRAQAGPVLELANTWEELERGLARHGLTLRAKGGGFVLTDGTQEVKASDVDRAFSGSRLKKRLDRQSEDAARAIEAAAPPAPVVLPATRTLPRESAARTIAAAAGHTDLDEQHQPIRSTRTPQFGDAGHGIVDLFRDPPQHQREQTGPALERAPVLQPREAESHAPAPAAADAVPVPAETSLGVTTVSSATDEAREPSHTAEPVREEVGPPALCTHPTRSVVEPLGQEPHRKRRKRGSQKATGEQVDLWSQAPTPRAPGAPAAPVPDVVPDQPAEAESESPEVVPVTPPLPVSPRPQAPASPRELVPATEVGSEEVPAAATVDHHSSAQSELAARINQLSRKASLRFLGETLTGAAPTRAAGNAPPREVEPVREEVEAEVPRLSMGTRSTDAEAFVQLAECCQELKDRIEQAEGTRARMEKLSADLDRANRDVRGATASFASEIKSTFRNPKAFYDWFSELSEDQRWAMLDALGKRPAHVARAFMAASGHDMAQASGLRSKLRDFGTRIKARLTGKKPEHSVFRSGQEGVIDRVGLLTAGAGERYLQAVGAREEFRVHLTDQLEIPRKSTLKDVRDVLATRKEKAAARTAEAITLRASLGARPSTVERAFLALSREDQRVVMDALPTLGKLIPKAVRLVERLARGPERGDGGLGL